MAIRITDAPARRGSVSGTLDGLAAAIAGSHVSPSGRIAVLGSQLQGAGSILAGQFTGPGRTGVIATVLDGAISAMQGSFAASGGSGGPGVPPFLRYVNQGGPGNDNDGNLQTSVTNYYAIQWGAAVPGLLPIVLYRVFRNGVAYADVTAQTTFTGSIAGNTMTASNVVGDVQSCVRYSAAGLLPETFVDYHQFTGTLGKAGTYPVNYAQTLAATQFSAWQFIDRAATNCIHPHFDGLNTVYLYEVCAVDSAGVEGPRCSPRVYIYEKGASNCKNGDLSFGGGTENYSSTSGNPQGSRFCLQIVVNPDLGLQPVTQAPLSPQWTLELGAFKYFTVDINPGATVNYNLQFGTLTRRPSPPTNGDVFGWEPTVTVFSSGGASIYGPTAVPNQWATYKIPIAITGMLACNFAGSITGNILTVTSVDPGGVVDGGGNITGPGMPTGTYTMDKGDANSSLGHFTLNNSVSGTVSSTGRNFTFTRTDLYKYVLFDPVHGHTYYLNNMGFTVN